MSEEAMATSGPRVGGLGERDPDRGGDWACTFTGRRFYPQAPRPGDIQIEDVAHSLAFQCRFGGHCFPWYSVAQHSVHASEICDPADALWGLLHDAAEAYLIDLPRPVKLALPAYRVLEDKVMVAVCERFGLAPQMPASVKHADEALLAAEAHALMPQRSVRGWYLPVAPAPITIDPWSPDEAERRFLLRYRELTHNGSRRG